LTQWIETKLLGAACGRSRSATCKEATLVARRGGFEPLSSVDVVPDRRLELEPVPSSRDDIDAALEELAYLKSRENTINAIVALKTRPIFEWANAQLVTRIADVDGQKFEVTFADRRKKLEAAIEAYQELHRDEIYGDGKTAQFNFGTLKLHKQPDGIAIRGGLEMKAIKAKLDELAAVKSTFAGWLSKRKLFGVPLAKLLRFKSEVSVEGIKKAFLAGELTLRSLNALGFEPSGGQDNFSLEVKQWTVKSEPRAAETAA
jgi:Bacteriophage Mu Gam like protein